MYFVFVYKHTTRVPVHFSLQHLITYMRRNAENVDSVSANREDVHFKSVFFVVEENRRSRSNKSNSPCQPPNAAE